jgi:hypothetical protein
MIFK